MKKLVLALGLLLLPSLAWAQNPTCPTRPLGDNSNACASTAFVQNAIPTGLTVYHVTSAAVGAKCDGVTDDTAAFKALATTITNAGGNAIIQFPAGAICRTYKSGQVWSGSEILFDFSAGLNNISIQGNGATITNDHVFVAPDTLYNIACLCSNYYAQGLKFVQTNAVSLPAATPYGTIGMVVYGIGTSSTNANINDITLVGGQVPVQFSNIKKIVATNITSTSSLYGLVANQCAAGSVTDLFVRNLVVDGSAHDRSVFLKCVKGADISWSSQNAGSNDLLISSDGAAGVTENLKLNYRIIARTAGTPVSYVTIGTGLACTTACANSIWRNIEINIDGDLSGDAIAVPLVKFTKGTTSSLGLVFEDIRINGIAVGIPAASGNTYDLFDAADSPWSGETAKKIAISIQNDGSATPSFYVDYAPFSTTRPGNLVLNNFSFPGNYTDTNNTNVLSIRQALNANFANLTCSTGCQGTWVPTLSGTTSGSWTLSTAVGSYEQVGNMATVRFTAIASGASSPVGNIQIGGLPFPAANVASDNGICNLAEQIGLTNAASYTTFAGVIAPAGTSILLVENGSGQSANLAAVARASTTPALVGQCTYRVY